MIIIMVIAIFISVKNTHRLHFTGTNSLKQLQYRIKFGFSIIHLQPYMHHYIFNTNS